MAAATFGRKGAVDADLARRRAEFIAAERARASGLAQPTPLSLSKSAPSPAQPEAPRPPQAKAAIEKNLAVAYIMWFVLGGISAHRFYLGYLSSAVAQLGVWLMALVTLLGGSVFGILFFLIWTVWLIADAFLIPGLCRRKNEQLRKLDAAYAFA